MHKTGKKAIKTAAIVVAGGSGMRFGGDVPKQYTPLRGMPILRHSVDTLLAHPAIDAVQVVIGAGQEALYAQAVKGLNLLPVVYGGKTRQASVLAGLTALEVHQPDKVLIHDAARPFLTQDLITRLLESKGNAIPALPVTDTIKNVSDHTVLETVNRQTLVAVQTPQAFDFSTILKAHQQADRNDYTDDAALCESQNIAVQVVAGERRNRKITEAGDIAELPARIATGFGYDVHAFGEAGEAVILCGIAVPYNRTLAGHSDADVGFHALVDALLGAIGEGDIGQHFPPSDLKWNNADSSQFVKYAVALASRRGGIIQNVDITFICERPKIGQYRDAMRQKTANLLGISEAHVNIKATTTEKLGFTGREEGIAATAVATIAFA